MSVYIFSRENLCVAPEFARMYVYTECKLVNLLVIELSFLLCGDAQDFPSLPSPYMTLLEWNLVFAVVGALHSI